MSERERKKLEEPHYWLGHNLYSINVADREQYIHIAFNRNCAIFTTARYSSQTTHTKLPIRSITGLRVQA